MKYAVTRGILREEIAPYGECVLVLKETKDYVTITGSRYGRGEDGITRISKRSVLFYTDHDITEQIRDANRRITAHWENHKQIAARIRLLVEADHALPTEQ